MVNGSRDKSEAGAVDMTNQTPESVIAEVIEYHADTIDSHYDGCHKHHAVCLAVKLRDMLREHECDAATDKPDPCEMTYTSPFDFAQCETHDTTFPLGGVCKWHGKNSIAAVLQDEADEQRGLKVRAEAERDAALAAVERVRAVLSAWEMVQARNRECFESGNPGMIVPIDCTGGIRAALDGAPDNESLPNHCQSCGAWGTTKVHLRVCSLDGAPEPEWEYVGMAFEHGGFMRIRNDQLAPEKFDSWRKLMKQYPRVEILKRVKAVPAGPWLPVEGESK